MSTRSIIALPLDHGFQGRYVHSNGYPTSRVPTLLALVKREGLDRVRAILIEENYGWSTVQEHTPEDYPNMLDARGRVIPGWGLAYTDTKLTTPPHGTRSQPYQQVTADEWWRHDNDPDAEYAYVLNEQHISVLERAGEQAWDHLGDVRYDEVIDEASLTKLECGENWERCRHMATAHIEGAPYMGMQTYLGLKPRGWRDKIAVILHGQRVEVTNSGGTGTARSADWRLIDWNNRSQPRYWWGGTAGGPDVRLARVLKNGGYRLDHDLVLAATRNEPEIIVPKGTVLKG